MRFVQIDLLPAARALVDVDKITHAVPQEAGARLFLGAEHQTRWRSRRRERGDDGEGGGAGIHVCGAPLPARPIIGR